MQKNVYEFVEKVVSENNIKGKILDVGSLDINGSVKAIFKDCEYIGIDIRAGKNVDRIMDSHYLSFDKQTFDCVVCCEMLEHDKDPFATLAEIYRVLKDRGFLIITAAGIGFPKHDCPEDFWRFTDSGMRFLLDDFKIISLKEEKQEVFCLARK